MNERSSARHPAANSAVKSSFASDVLTLATGSIFAQALMILASPLLTRLYDPDDFGIYALFISMTGIVTTIACLRYDIAIMLPERDDEAANVLALSLILAFSISAFTIPFLWLAKAPLLRLLNAQGLEPYFWLLPLAIFLGGTASALNYWNSRTKHFKRLSMARITSSVTTTCTQLGAGLTGYAAGGSLIGGSMAGSAVSVMWLGSKIRHDSYDIRKSIHMGSIGSEFKRYCKFPTIDLLSALLNTLSWQIPVILLSAFFSSTIVGFYALGFRVIHLPMSFLGSSISQVFFKRCVEANADGTLNEVVEKVFRILVVLSLLPMLVLTISGGEIFIFIFGENWVEAGIYAQFLGLWAFIWFVSSPIATLYFVLERQEFGLKLNIINFVTRLISIYVGGMMQSPRIAIILFALTGIIVYGYLLITLFDYAYIPRQIILQILSTSFVKVIPACTILIAFKLMEVGPMIQTLASGTMIIIFYIYIIKTDPFVRSLADNLRGSRLSKN